MKLNWAERWAVNNPSRPIQQRLEIRWMKRKMSPPAGFSILEVGCGRGAATVIIQREFQPAVLHAMDLDIQMIRRARRYLHPEQREGISFYVSDVRRLPYRNGGLNTVFGFGVLHHVPDWQEALGEIARVLKEGGIFFFEELYPSLYGNFLTKHILLHPRENRFRSPDLKEALKNTGLPLQHLLEHPKIGILGIAMKRPCP